MVLRDLSSNCTSQIVAADLIEAPVDSAEDARIIHIVGDFLKLAVVLSDRSRWESPERGNSGHQRDVVARRTEQAPHDLESAVRAAGVI